MLRVKGPRDFWAGLMFMAFGAGGLWLNQEHPLGTAAQMGPGYFPMLLCLGLMLLGLISACRGLAVDSGGIARGFARPILVLVSAIVAFGLLIGSVGLAPTVLIAAGVASFAAREQIRWGEMAMLAIGLSAFTVLLFVYLLGLPLPVWGEH